MGLKFLTVTELNKICEEMIKNNKGDYNIYLSTGGYYDGYAIDNSGGYYVEDDRKELCLSAL